MKLAVFIGVFLASVALCTGQELNVLVMGDWGGQDTWPFYTIGEAATAHYMGVEAEKLSPSFVLGIGDNFYTYGVKDIHDSRFNTTFENVFTSSALNIPFYFLAGNHDHYGNASAEVAYTQHSWSGRWKFPSFWYNIKQTVGDQTVEIVMIDTVILAGLPLDTAGNDVDGQHMPGPWDAEMAQSELQWLDQTLAASTADYLIVAGHYPVWSICEHGPTSYLVENVKPLLEKYEVTTYLAGHDHCAEYIRDPADSAGIDYHGVGAAHSLDSSTDHKDDIPANSLKFHYGSGGVGAFAGISISSKGIVVTHYGDNGNVLYTAPAHGPRSSAAKAYKQQ